ncbi:hypothetical protein NC651_009763 [Populus alba x Populus x berolinensis]|nr:hypothetical protein NC651_009763 [Populus alba x Populus x berolinensis]
MDAQTCSGRALSRNNSKGRKRKKSSDKQISRSIKKIMADMSKRVGGMDSAKDCLSHTSLAGANGKAGTWAKIQAKLYSEGAQRKRVGQLAFR